ncbi:MAG: cyclase family protein [Candidatus Saccharibacteria bacterium]
MIYDLTHEINPELPVYPGDPHVQIAQAASLNPDGYADRLLTMGTHNGTHMDAPAHMLAGGKELKEYSADRFVAEAVCVDVRDGFEAAQVSEAITMLGETAVNKAVVFCTGASDHFTEQRYWDDDRVLDDATTQVLIESGIRLVGIDKGSFDNDEPFPVHKALLGADILLVENLTNLAPLAGKTFRLYALPLKLEADGAPARVLAEKP